MAGLRLTAAVLALLAAIPAFAQKPDEPRRGPEPQRSFEPPRGGGIAYPLPAIGVVQRSEGFCTGTLVGPRIVLTAAHCMFRTDGSQFEAVTFRTGFNAGRPMAEAREIRRFVAPGFDFGRFRSMRGGDQTDWALVLLERDIGSRTAIVEVRSLSDSDLRARGDLTIIGYGRNGGRRAHVIQSCRVESAGNGTYAHRCGTGPGDSGAPNLVLESGRYVLVGIESRYVAGAGGSMDGAVSAVVFANAVISALRAPAP